MPTPVGVARQCLTKEAAQVLDEAVAVARRRGHPQTTSLHAVSALLSSSSSLLRDACARARNIAYSPRLQFKALDLCLGISLDRVPSTHLNDDPPVSNSLMAAIKRSQANQRRQPENFHLYHQISQQSSSVSCIKVELQHLILSILDDPVVSRVFGEAGFRSPEIKVAILGPLPQLLRYSRSGCAPPLFLCNFTDRWDPGRRSFAFPFTGVSDSDENIRKIGEVLVRSRCNNPLLVGARAVDALQNFIDAIEKRKGFSFLPAKLFGLNVMSIGEDISKSMLETNSDQRTMNLNEMVKPSSLEPGMLVSLGDLKSFLDEHVTDEAVNYAVAQLTNLLKLNTASERLWLIGAVTSYEYYLKFVRKFPSIDKDWDLQLLPITSLKPSTGESFLKPGTSLMESFVPLGGFFSATPELINSAIGANQDVPHSQLYHESCKESSDVSKENIQASVATEYQHSLPSWFRRSECGPEDVSSVKTKDDRPDEFKDIDLHKGQVEAQLLTVHPEFLEDKTEHFRNNIQDTSRSKFGSLNLNPSSHVSVQNISNSLSSIRFPTVSKAKDLENPRKVEDLDSGGLATCRLSNSSIGDCSEASPTSVITTDLELGILSSRHKSSAMQHLMVLPEKNSSRFSSNDYSIKGNIADHPVRSSSCSDCSGLFDTRDFKMVSGSLREKVSWQAEAADGIARIAVHSRTRARKLHGAAGRGDIWLNFVGPDKYSKKKMAITLADLYSQGNFVSVDLSSFETKGYDAKFRGKTAIDYIVGELLRNPLSVIFLENVDKADLLEQNSLSHAIGTGKILDLHGREVSTTNAIFVTCFSGLRNNAPSSNEYCSYSEETIMSLKGSSMQITIEYTFLDKNSCKRHCVSNLVHKRKPNFDDERHRHHEVKRSCKSSNLNLDLNLPANENELLHIDDCNPEKDYSTENENCWLQDLFDKMAETIIFKPCDFDALAAGILRDIMKSFHAILGFDCVLEIEPVVMEQLIAAAYVSERHRAVEDWIEQVLGRGFAEAQQKHNLTGHFKAKLAACEGVSAEKHVPGVYLPSRIIVH